MKKGLIIAILLSYSIASFGVSLNYFYCCGKLKTVSFVSKTRDKDCTDTSKKGCCDNKTVTVQLKADQKSNEQIYFDFPTPLSPGLLSINDYVALSLATNYKLNPFYKRPPPDRFPSRSILFGVFRI